MDNAFRVFAPDQGSLLPPSLDDWLPAEHLARFIAVLVDEHLDVVRMRAACTEGRGAPPCDPRLMVRVLLYGYIIGVRSSRLIERKCVDDVCFRWLAKGAAPDYRAIARFRTRHLAALGQLFVQALALCQAAGMVRLGRVALDGTRVRANVLAEEVSALLADAERIDKSEDAALGENSRGGEVAEQPRRRETALAEIRGAKAALEAEAGQQAPERAAQRPDCGGDDDSAAGEGAGTGGKVTAKSKVQRALVGAVLLALTFAGGYAVAVHKTVTLSVDGVPMTVSTMKSRVIDVVRENGFAVGEHDDLYPGANQLVHQSDTIVLRRGRPLQVSIDGQPSKQVWTTALTVDEALKQLSMSDAAPAAASRASRLPLAGMALPVVSAKTRAHQRRRCGQRPALGGSQRGPAAGCGRCAVGAGRQGGAPGVDAGHRGHADRGHPHPDAQRHRAHGAAGAAAAHPRPDIEHQPPRRRGPRHSRYPGRHVRRLDRQRCRNRPTAGGPQCRDTRPAVGTAGRCQAGHPGAAGEQQRDLGCAGLLRVQR